MVVCLIVLLVFSADSMLFRCFVNLVSYSPVTAVMMNVLCLRAMGVSPLDDCDALRKPRKVSRVHTRLFDRSVEVSGGAPKEKNVSVILSSCEAEIDENMPTRQEEDRRLYSSRACALLDAWTPKSQRLHTCPGQDVKLLAWLSR